MKIEPGPKSLPVGTASTVARTIPAKPSDAPAPAPIDSADGLTVPAASAPSSLASTAAVTHAHQSGLRQAFSFIGGAIGYALGKTAAVINCAYFGVVDEIDMARSTRFQKANPSFDHLQVPQIDRPYVLAPGFSTSPASYAKYVQFLTRGSANGGETYFVKTGSFYTMGADGTLQPLAAPPRSARVFEMVWTDPRQSMDINAIEMRQNLDAITRVTGVSKVDVEGYSAGGLDARLYLDQGGDKINRLMMLGTPNHGTRSADVILDTNKYNLTLAQKLSKVSPHDDPAMEWLRMSDNQKLPDLNAHQARQLNGVPTLNVGTDAEFTQGQHGFGLHPGDRIVTVNSLELPGVKTVMLHDSIEHGQFNNDPNLVPVRTEFFGWTLPANSAPQP